MLIECTLDQCSCALISLFGFLTFGIPITEFMTHASLQSEIKTFFSPNLPFLDFVYSIFWVQFFSLFKALVLTLSS